MSFRLYIKQIRGFSLVELSIVIVIISLILAAIASGVHLSKAAKLNKIASELSGYKTAIDNFRVKYSSLPGDMPNATNYWSNATNGNGDERIDNINETLGAWHQLAKSNMISGNYTGNKISEDNFVSGSNVPTSEIKGAYYIIQYIKLYDYANGKSGNSVQLVTTENGKATGGAISAADARIIDKKFDNTANPVEGNIVVFRSENNQDNNQCVTSSYMKATTADYITSDSQNSCRILLWLEN